MIQVPQEAFVGNRRSIYASDPFCVRRLLQYGSVLTAISI